jgi:hypothetical protein
LTFSSLSMMKLPFLNIAFEYRLRSRDGRRRTRSRNGAVSARV